MSLLMDALKQAEHAKRDKHNEAAPLETQAAKSPVADTPKDPAELSLSPVDALACPEPLTPEPTAEEGARAPRLALATAQKSEPEQKLETISISEAVSAEPEPSAVLEIERPKQA
ncbi:MAG: hypothetical protein KKA36_07620, partial [Gammaproteobacteria bacterium]|nr:hypothetical protein [Gammaproteobacteria bacterium]